MTTFSSNSTHLPGPGDLPAYRPEYWDDDPGEYIPDPKVTQCLTDILSGMSVLEYCRRMDQSPAEMASLLAEFGVRP
jgi:hypothetical protein